MTKLLGLNLLAGLALLASGGILHAAAEMGNNKRDKEELEYRLEKACGWCDLDIVEGLLRLGTDPDAYDVLHGVVGNKDPKSLELIDPLIAYGADIEKKWDGRGTTVFEAALGAWLPFEQKKAKVLALIRHGVNIDLGAVQKAKKNGLDHIARFERELAEGPQETNERGEYCGLSSMIARGMKTLEEAEKFGGYSIMSREEWDQLEQVIPEAQEAREQLRCDQVAIFLPRMLAEIVGQYQRGPAGEFDDMPPLEDAPEEDVSEEESEQ